MDPYEGAEHMDPMRASYEQYLKMRKVAGEGHAPLETIQDPELRKLVAGTREWAAEWLAEWEQAHGATSA